MVWPTLNEGLNSSKSHKNRCPCLSYKWVLKSTFKTQFRESRLKCIFSTLVWLILNGGQNNYRSNKNRFQCLSLKWVPISTFKTQLWESLQRCIFSTLFDQPWKRPKIAQNLIKIGVHAYLSNAYLNPLSKLNSKKVKTLEEISTQNGPFNSN